MWFENHKEAVAISPDLPRGTVSTETTDLRGIRKGDEARMNDHKAGREKLLGACELPVVRTYFLFLGLALVCGTASAQTRAAFHPDRMDTVLYGVAYYPEYMPYDRLDQDIQLMQKAGITVVRIGESSWGLWEPEDGKFEFAWMDRVVDKLHAAGIRIILGTPTYSIPAWMYKEHPEIVVTRLGGQYLYYGLRQNTDLLNPTYRFYCERVIRKILEHYKNNPAIIG
ncbi:MAG TPA: beta-galactosidase, partial [Candidatus Dormibacteraeota bacterium]|nr:beta-galactosidase [Candidatus Dormibacteraeota bacterium]